MLFENRLIERNQKKFCNVLENCIKHNKCAQVENFIEIGSNQMGSNQNRLKNSTIWTKFFKSHIEPIYYKFIFWEKFAKIAESSNYMIRYNPNEIAYPHNRRFKIVKNEQSKTLEISLFD